MYVLEGATLGGQIISRSLGGRFGLTPQTGLRFCSSYGAQAAFAARAVPANARRGDR